MTSKTLTPERLRELLSYDPETGVFRWKTTKPRSSARPGDIAGSVDNGYRFISVDRARHCAHRLAWLYVYGEMPRRMIDHIDGNRGNNAIENLRDVSRSVNGQNQKRAQSHNALGMLGVTRLAGSRRRPYQAYITVGGKPKYLGVFATADEAGAAYIDAKRRMHEGCTL